MIWNSTQTFKIKESTTKMDHRKSILYVIIILGVLACGFHYSIKAQDVTLGLDTTSVNYLPTSASNMFSNSQ